MAEHLTRLDPAKFRDPIVTLTGAPRARVALRALDTLWFNTGTLCNLTCGHCYIEASVMPQTRNFARRSMIG